MPELPEDVVEEAARLSSLALEATDQDEAAAYRDRRDMLVAEYGFNARVREEPDRNVLVCYPEEWVDDQGVLRRDALEDTSRAVEVPLSGGEADYEDAEERNRAIARRVREQHGEVHGANADAFADFMSNHYARRIDSATEGEAVEFLEEYYPRNAWPTPDESAVVEESLRYVFDAAGTDYPLD